MSGGHSVDGDGSPLKMTAELASDITAHPERYSSADRLVALAWMANYIDGLSRQITFYSTRAKFLSIHLREAGT